MRVLMQIVIYLYLLALLAQYTVASAAFVGITRGQAQSWMNFLPQRQRLVFHPIEDVTRKMIPKSIFIAPKFSRCRQGYRMDSNGDCYQILRIDERALLASRLNVLYANRMTSTKSPQLMLPFEKQPKVMIEESASNDNKPFKIQIPIQLVEEPQKKKQKWRKKNKKRKKIEFYRKTDFKKFN